MSLYVILLLLAIQGLVPSCCAALWINDPSGSLANSIGHSGEEESGEGPLKEEDWRETSDSSTGEDDNFTGFDSGWSSADRGRNDEGPRTYPRISRTFSNKRFVTSGVGEDNGGSQDDDGSQSKSNGSQDQGSAYENFESNMDLAKIGDAIDVMKKLKKAKSDQEFTKKLRSGPESLGVAFKTFEQLSGLWISVMHRIWRVWKAKGAKVVMHSIVHDLINNTGRAITRKVGDMLSKKAVVDLNGSGSATFKDEGSTEPEQSHSPATIHNQTGPSVERVSIDFRKNIPKEVNTSPPSTKKEREPVEKVKVSFFSRNVSDSKEIQQSSIQRQPKRLSEQGNDTLLAQETSAVNGKKDITDKNKKTSKAVDTSSMVASNVKFTNSSTKTNERIPKTNGGLESRDNKKKAFKNSIGDVGRNEERNVSDTEPEVTQHVDENNDEREKNNAIKKLNGDQIANYSVSNSVTQSQSGVTHVQEETNKQIPAEHAKQTTRQFNENDKNSSTNIEGRNNERSSAMHMINNVTQEKVSERTNDAGNKTGKTRVLETLKINFLKKNRTSHLDRNNTSNSQVNALETQRNVKLDSESNSKADSEKVGASSKLSPAGGSDKTRASVLDKKDSNLNKSDVASNGANSQHTAKGDKEMSNTKGTDTSTGTRTTTSTKSEKIIVNLRRKEEKSKQNKTSITKSVNHQEVDKDTHQKNQNGKTLDTFPKNTQMAKTNIDANSIPLKIKSTVVHSKEQKINSSSANISHKRAINVQHDQNPLKPLSNGLVETLKNGALNSSKANETIPKVNTQVTKKDVIPSDIDSESSQNHNEGSKGDERRRIESERMRNVLDKISKQSVDKMTDKANTKQTDRGSVNSKKSVGVSNDLSKKKRLENMGILTTNTSHERITEASQKLEGANHFQRAATNGEEVKNVREDAEYLNLQKHPNAGHDDVKKDQSNTEIRTLQDKNNTEIQTDIKSFKLRDHTDTSSVIQNSTSITLARSVKKDSETSKKATHHPQEISFEVSEKDHRISPPKSTGSHKDIAENPKIEKETSKYGAKNDGGNGTVHADRAMGHGSERGLTHVPGNGVTHAPGSGMTHDPGSSVTHSPGSGMTHDPGSGVTHDPGSGVTHDPGSGVTHDTGSGVTHDTGSGVKHELGSGVKHDPGNGATRNPGSDVAHETKGGETHGSGSNATPVPKNESTEPVINAKRVSDQVLNSPKRVPDSPHKQSSQLIISSARSTTKLNKADLKITKSSSTPHTNDVKTAHFKKAKTQTNTKHVTQASRRTKEEERPPKGHHMAAKENSKSDDQKEPIKMQNNSSRTNPKPTDATKEDIKPSKPQQVDVLTSRTPPTSLLTTSNDDNTYSIKQIVQGPKGSSFVYGNQDDEKVRKLEKKVSKLESEVTVLETAMADLAKRLLVVEQKSEIPRLAPEAIFPNPSKEPEPRAQHPVHSQQQTTVYVTKDLGTPPQNRVPQYGPDKIVIPISSLYPGGASSVSTASASQHVEVDRQEPKVDNHLDEQDQEKPQDSTHVTLREGTRPSPISEAHAVVRPIVNIIVPNNRDDLLSEGAICMPRCQNGGRCFDRNICRCPTFFTGDHCERFSLRDLLESPTPRERPYRKLQRVVVSEPPDRQVLDGTLNLDPGSPALEYRDLNQDLEPGKEYVAKQQPVEVASPGNSAEVDGAARRRQLILEI